MKAASLCFATIAGLVPALASAQTGNATVNASADVYAAGSQSGLVTSNGVGTLPSDVTVSGGTYLTFSVPTVGGAAQTITINGGGNFNDADGVGAAPANSYNSGYGSISGLNAPGGGELVGVFIDGSTTGPTGSAPTELDYTSTGNSSESDSTYSPVLDQVFFIGDGLTGDGTGTTQEFYVPTGATDLYLGITDACNYNGGPSCYGDNSGSFNVDYDLVTVGTPPPPPAPTPEPSSLMLLGTGVLGAAGALRRRMRISR